ncbi:hypothetical protein [Chroococcus sp. FPU101]|uniref:AbrB/MazE/SpoVT family DNA-binding domain-containing protein n=1 Tax=Chroococcus sp. FPU101 TaxID=1974212 RepID=UPI001A8D4287|nr:hypothetical protein [Chroococcus sp. FPU101]GFE68076.1 hypothetical protein CFPU101_06860 [Chroococcus sp. FPU101]
MNDIKNNNIEHQSEKDLKTKFKRNQKYSLDELVEKITLENRHQGVDSGFPVGKEIW